MERIRQHSWPGGANNRAPAERLPEGFVRQAHNVDIVNGKFLIRPGRQRIYEGLRIRGAVTFGSKIIIADHDQLVELDTLTNSHRTIATITAAGPFSGAELGGLAYLSTVTQALIYDGNELYPWGVPDLLRQPLLEPMAGGLPAGHYRVAATLIDQRGREGGTDSPAIIAVPEKGGLRITLDQPAEGCTQRLYVSRCNSQTLYLQGEYAAAATVEITQVRDDTVDLKTQLMRAPAPCRGITRHNGVLVLDYGKTLQVTEPLAPHLTRRASRFFQFPRPVGVVVSAGGYLYVSADKCYRLSGIETDSPEQVVVSDVPAIPGTGVRLENNEAAWMTRRGQAVTAGGLVQLINDPAYAPGDYASGAAGLVDTNGTRRVVTSAKQPDPVNGLGMTDYFFGEVIE